jgi:uncharacterized protein with GYD domain
MAASTNSEYIVTMGLTPAGAKDIDATLTRLEERASEVAATLAGVGDIFNLDKMYVTMGPTDIVAIVDVTDESDAVYFSTQMAATGLVTTTTSRAYSTEAVRGASKK